jgi:hypothetical protein
MVDAPMAGDASKGFGKFIGRFRERFEKLSETVSSAPEDDWDLILAVIQRIDVEGEPPAESESGAKDEGEYEDEVYQKLMRRLQWQLSKSGITPEDVINSFPGEVQSVLLYRSYDKFRGKESNLLRERFIEMGWKNIQPNLWLLPPNKTPGGQVNSGDLKVWVRKKLAKPFGKDFDYVFPVVAVIDMKKVTADKKGIRKMPTARTIFNVLEPDEVVPCYHVYSVMKSRGYGIKDIILSGNIPFLASAFATQDELMAIQENEEAIVATLKQLTGSQSVNLQDIANLGADLVADAFGSTVTHGRDLAQRLIVEAQFWMRHLGGAVPEPGPMPSAITARAQPEREKVEPAQQGEQWGGRREEEKKEEEAKPLASQESWFEPGEKSGDEGDAGEEVTESEAVAEAKVSDDRPKS